MKKNANWKKKQRKTIFFLKKSLRNSEKRFTFAPANKQKLLQ